MSTGLAVFDTTVQQSNEWLKAIEARLQPCGLGQAYGAFRAVTHVLRDRLPMEGSSGSRLSSRSCFAGCSLRAGAPGTDPPKSAIR